MTKFIKLMLIISLFMAANACFAGIPVEQSCKSISTDFSVESKTDRLYLSVRLSNNTMEPIELFKEGIHFGSMNFKAFRLDSGTPINFTPAMVGVPPGSFAVNSGETHVATFDLYWLFPTLKQELETSDVKVSFIYMPEPITFNMEPNECIKELKVTATIIIKSKQNNP